ncbi:hypothetical protein F0726_00051 [Acidithiobacillus caldus]|nr:hypothetical protein F0726_00051 [Acidithiobacillus caldus]
MYRTWKDADLKSMVARFDHPSYKAQRHAPFG